MLHELFNEFIYVKFGVAGPQPISPVPYPRTPRPQPQPFSGVPFLNISLSFHGPSPAETPKYKGPSQHRSWQFGPHSTEPNMQYEIRTVFTNEPSIPHENTPWRYQNSYLNYWKCVST
jgi:hypothetical protein